MLKIAAQSSQKFGSRSGQAIMEFVPSMTLFFIVMSAGYNYFKVMRSAQIREEAARNIMFQKINYSGTLTSPLYENQSNFALSAFNNESVGQNKPVYQQNNCMGVAPGGAKISTGKFQLLGVEQVLNPVEIVTYAVIYRRPTGPACVPDM